MAEEEVLDFGLVCNLHGIVMTVETTQAALDANDRVSPAPQPCPQYFATGKKCQSHAFPALLYKGLPGPGRVVHLECTKEASKKLFLTLEEYLDAETATAIRNVMEAFLESDCERVWCSCGRTQKDIGAQDLEAIGWRKIDGEWQCPFCTGNTDNLKKAFDGG